MIHRVSEAAYRAALSRFRDAATAPFAFAGRAGAQLHAASRWGLSRAEPNAPRIEVVALGEPSQGPQYRTARGTVLPSPLRGSGYRGPLVAAPFVAVSGLGFEPSIEARLQWVELGGERFPVAAPEHILGLLLAGPEPDAGALWTCFVLLRAFDGDVDFEEVRGFLKRCRDPQRQSLLSELAYLAG